ncbi:TIGR00282 family metallophosphoesterase [Kamptonema cortianum]|nr:TIGR00282 family metallophosphoesterase [Geitlerinema splendidum]MDK3160933.1 TIGR00282 family metallophosphoesterase [Kamptonema cortianum]
MSSYKILFLGDIVGRPGREVVLRKLDSLLNQFDPRFVIVNGENSAAGVGITPSIADELFAAGIDAITLGNHAFNKREIFPYLDEGRPIIRPANLPASNPGKGICQVKRDGTTLNLINLSGRIYMDGYDDPFQMVDGLLESAQGTHIFVDFHAEATSEKQAMGFYLAGRITALVGTHTHVTTADECILDGGTAYITDVGMCGPYPSVLGMDKDIILRKFTTRMPTRFEVADAPGVISGVVISVQETTGRAIAIERLPRTSKGV